MKVSWNRGTQMIYFNGIFHYKPSSYGGSPKAMETPTWWSMPYWSPPNAMFSIHPEALRTPPSSQVGSKAPANPQQLDGDQNPDAVGFSLFIEWLDGELVVLWKSKLNQHLFWMVNWCKWDNWWILLTWTDNNQNHSKISLGHHSPFPRCNPGNE